MLIAIQAIDCGLQQIVIIAEGRSVAGQQPFDIALLNPDFRLTASVGIASYRPGERVEDVIQRADQALYAAKAAGRDRIVIGE